MSDNSLPTLPGNGAEEEIGRKRLTAYRIPGYSRYMKIMQAPADRFWMDFSTQGWANRCLPLRIANQAGWHLLSDCEFEAEWTGQPDLASVKINYKSNGPSPFLGSSFGYGILTWYVPYVFRTPPGYNLLVRGPANAPKNGISPLEGLVETDWTVAAFTVNWRITRPAQKVKFEKDEPIAMIVPQLRRDLESFIPEIRNMEGELREEFDLWLKSRQSFVKEKEANLHHREHQGHYTRGETVRGDKAPEHQNKLVLKPFTDVDPPPERTQPPPESQVDSGPKPGLLARLLRK